MTLEKLPSTNEREEMLVFVGVKILKKIEKEKGARSDNITAELLQAGEEHMVKATRFTHKNKC